MNERYSKPSIAMHWLMLVLLAAVYACIELRELYPKGSDPREMLKQWHFALGLTVFALVWIRMIARVLGTTPPIVPAVPPWQRALAHAVEFTLYALMIVLPILGWVTLSAKGTTVSFFGFELPALLAPNEPVAARTKELHETLGTAGYFLVALHAGAALYHHYVRRDNTLTRMRLSGRAEPSRGGSIR